MSVTASAAFSLVRNDRPAIRLRNCACFGHFNYLRRVNVGDSGLRADAISSEIEMYEYWPHINKDTLEANVTRAVNALNFMSVYKDMFILSPLNTVQVNLREHPADKVFTGYMSLRNWLHYASFKSLWTYAPEERKAEADAISVVLEEIGVSIDMMGNISFSERSSTSESTCTLISSHMDAICLYLMLYASTSETSQCWAQNCVGVDENYQGYLRNGRDGMSRVINRRGYSSGTYSSMSHWLRAWLSVDTFLSPEMIQKKGRLTVGNFVDRMMSRVNSQRGEENRANIVLSMFEELKEMYE